MKELMQVWHNKWHSLSPREQYLLFGGSVLGLIAAVYFYILQPFNESLVQAQMEVQSAEQLLSLVEKQADEILLLRQTKGANYSSQSLNQIISTSARQYNIELIRIQPANNSLQVWINDISFDQFLNWLGYLQEMQGIRVELLDLEKTNISGQVNIKRLQFIRG